MADENPVQVADLLHRLTKRIRRAQAERLAPIGLTPAQERALRMIGRSQEPPRMTELAEWLGIVPRSLTNVIDSLEEDGLVRREIDPRNRRATLLHLTERGAAVREDMRNARRAAAEELLAPLSPDDRQTLTRLLTEIDAPGDARGYSLGSPAPPG
jgi:DNA-binding MarR family transcriptional regulator